MRLIELTRINKFTVGTSRISINTNDISEIKESKKGCSITMLTSGETYKINETYDEVIAKTQDVQKP